MVAEKKKQEEDKLPEEISEEDLDKKLSKQRKQLEYYKQKLEILKTKKQISEEEKTMQS